MCTALLAGHSTRLCGLRFALFLAICAASAARRPARICSLCFALFLAIRAASTDRRSARICSDSCALFLAMRAAPFARRAARASSDSAARARRAASRLRSRAARLFLGMLASAKLAWNKVMWQSEVKVRCHPYSTREHETDNWSHTLICSHLVIQIFHVLTLTRQPYEWCHTAPSSICNKV